MFGCDLFQFISQQNVRLCLVCEQQCHLSPVIRILNASSDYLQLLVYKNPE